MQPRKMYSKSCIVFSKICWLEVKINQSIILGLHIYVLSAWKIIFKSLYVSHSYLAFRSLQYLGLPKRAVRKKYNLVKINTFLSFFCRERIIFWEGNILGWGRKSDSFKFRGVYFQKCWITESLWFLPTGKYSEIQKTHSYPSSIKYNIILL